MNLKKSLEHYYRRLMLNPANEADPRLNSYFLDVHDLALLIIQKIQDTLNQLQLPFIQFNVHAIKEDMLAFIVITIKGGLDNFPVYRPSIVKKWLKKTIPEQNGLIESSWYSSEFKLLEKILNLIVERYNYATDRPHILAKRYWTLSEIDIPYEEKLMKMAVEKLKQEEIA